MKDKKKLICILAGVIFLARAIYGVSPYAKMLMIPKMLLNNLKYQPLPLVISIMGLVLLVIMGIGALQMKPRGKVIDVLAVVYFGYLAVNAINYVDPYTMRRGVDIVGLLILAVVVAAFVLSGLVVKEAAKDAKSGLSVAAKIQARKEVQKGIYARQLQSGILTQEEYDQIMGNMA